MTDPSKDVPAPGMVAMAHRFWIGFVTPSRFALGTMTGFTFLAFLLMFLFITPAWVANTSDIHLARDTRNSDGFATHEAIRLALSAPDHAMHSMVVIGDSIIAQVLARDDLLTKDLDAATMEPWHISFLTTAGQTPLDEAALAEYATKRQPSVVVLSLSFGRLGYGQRDLINAYRQARLGFRSDWEDRDVAMLGGQPEPRTGIYVIDNRKFVARLRMPDIGTWRARPAPRRIDIYLLDEHVDPDRLVHQRKMIMDALRGGVRADDPGIQILADTARRLIGAGNRLILVEDPINQAVFDSASDKALYAAYLRQSAALAHKLGGYYCPLGTAYKPVATAFMDYFHLNDAVAQSRFRQILAGCVAEAEAHKPVVHKAMA